MRIVAAVAEFTRDVRPELRRRYVALLLDGLRAARPAPSPLGEGPLQIEELAAAKAAWRSSHA